MQKSEYETGKKKRIHRSWSWRDLLQGAQVRRRHAGWGGQKGDLPF